MRISKVVIQQFRGIRSLDWETLKQPLCCLIGPGDSAKTTVLDAIEAALSPRWVTFSEADFHGADTSQDIVIDVTVGELSTALLSDERFGLYLSGLAEDGTAHDEPEDTDEPVLTVRLTVDATMEPVWSLTCARYPAPRILSNRDRALFGVVRLAGEEARHLTWAQGSVLAKITDSTDGAAQRLAAAYRTARQSADLGSIAELTTAAAQAERQARSLGAYISDHYVPDLELGRGGFSSGAIALHDGAVPLRLAGLGTRRLATLAVQRAAVAEGAVVLVDELEQGLEPHRILAAMSQLRRWQEEASVQGRPQGQILMTTHSEVALSELAAPALFVMRRSEDGTATVQHAATGGDVARILKHSPRAFFGRRILVCEGATELGLMLGLREIYPHRHGGTPIEHRGSAVIDGHGAAAPPLACALAWLGYPTALYRDSDRPLDSHWASELQRLRVTVIEYGHGHNTEEAAFHHAPDDLVNALLTCVQEQFDTATIVAQLRLVLPYAEVTRPFNEWLDPFTQRHLHRGVIAQTALQHRWFKSEVRGRAIAPVMDALVQRCPDSPASHCLRGVEAWLYA